LKGKSGFRKEMKRSTLPQRREVDGPADGESDVCARRSRTVQEGSHDVFHHEGFTDPGSESEASREFEFAPKTNGDRGYLAGARSVTTPAVMSMPG